MNNFDVFEIFVKIITAVAPMIKSRSWKVLCFPTSGASSVKHAARNTHDALN